MELNDQKQYIPITDEILASPDINLPKVQARMQCSGCNKMSTYDYLKFLPAGTKVSQLVEVKFKNTRKGFYVNTTDEVIKKGDIVAVEATSGHDIGVVSLTGDLVPRQMKRCNIKNNAVRKLYRKAKPGDIEKWYQAISREEDTMKEARRIVEEMNMPMKISDVEFQGDKTKATFYFISEARVDFRQLIKHLAEHFKVHIEMKQIGSRQEAAKVGGIGPCGRELCCASWMAAFNSVSTSAARVQELVINPQKLAGQCGKLKCCLNFEVAGYQEARKDFPDTSIVLETENGRGHHIKTDVYRRIMWYSLIKDGSSMGLIPLDVDVVSDIIEQNRAGKKVEALIPVTEEDKEPVIDYQNAAGEDNIRRFEEKKKKKKKKKKAAANTNADNSAAAQLNPTPKAQPSNEPATDKPAPAKKKKKKKKSNQNNSAAAGQAQGGQKPAASES